MMGICHILKLIFFLCWYFTICRNVESCYTFEINIVLDNIFQFWWRFGELIFIITCCWQLKLSPIHNKCIPSPMSQHWQVMVVRKDEQCYVTFLYKLSKLNEFNIIWFSGTWISCYSWFSAWWRSRARITNVTSWWRGARKHGHAMSMCFLKTLQELWGYFGFHEWRQQRKHVKDNFWVRIYLTPSFWDDSIHDM